VNYARANSLRTQQAIARFGKGARHPVCLAWLELAQMEAELSAQRKDVELSRETISEAKQNKQEVIKLYHKAQNEKVAYQASMLLGKINEHLSKAENWNRAAVKLRSIFQELHQVAAERFDREWDAATRAKDTKALRALQRVRKRWNDKAFLVSDRITLEIVKMHRDKKIKAAWALDGALAGYMEAAFGGNRALSDEAWQGRLTTREVLSRLVDAGIINGSRAREREQLHEIRRVTRGLGIRLAEDQRGRKWKPPYQAKQEPKPPRGRPRGKIELDHTGNLELTQARKVRARMGVPHDGGQRPLNPFWRPSEEDHRAFVEAEKEIRRLRRILRKMLEKP
jgi:hypothetical protein